MWTRQALLFLVVYAIHLAVCTTIPEHAKKMNGKKFVKLLAEAGLIDMLSGTGESSFFIWLLRHMYSRQEL